MKIKDKDQFWEILVPGEFTIDKHRKWDEEVCKIAGGLTVLSKYVSKGRWVNHFEGFAGSDIMKESMIPVRVACTMEQLTRILEFTLAHYNQEAIMVYKISDKVLLAEK